MALNNTQYESIMREYERVRDENHFLHNRRMEEIEKKLPEYLRLESSVSSVSVAYAKALLEDQTKEAEACHQKLVEIRTRKQALLQSAGYPSDYLDPVYTCPDCQDTGYLVSDSLHQSKCHCLRQKELKILYQQSNIQDQIAKDNFSTLTEQYYKGEDLVHFRKAVTICRQFVEHFDTQHDNLLFYGTVGTGKSFLSGCVAAELLKREHSVIYFSSVSLFETLSRHSFDAKEKETLYNFYEDLYNCELVIIDDLGTELTNAFVASQLFSLLNERQLRRKSTIISTNLSLEELRDRYSDRVFSRITSHFNLCKLTGMDIRMLKKKSSLAKQKI